MDRQMMLPLRRKRVITLFHICRLLNCNVLPSNADEESMVLQIESLSYIFEKFKASPLLKNQSFSEITDGFIDIVSYMNKYFPVTSMDRKEFWKNVFRLGKSEGMVDLWKGALLIIESSYRVRSRYTKCSDEDKDIRSIY